MNIKGYGRLPGLDSAQAGLSTHVPNLSTIQNSLNWYSLMKMKRKLD